MLNREKLLMNRTKFTDLPETLQKNTDRLIGAVNGLLLDLWRANLLSSLEISISSGYRTPEIAAKVGSKKSYHTLCLAVDIVDDKAQTLAKTIAANQNLLQKHNLWLENPEFTRGKWTNWVHLDLGTRSDRTSRMFNP